MGDSLGQRIQIEGSEGPVRFEFGPVMADEDLAVDKEDVSFDAGEAVVEGVVQRSRVAVVVVGMTAD